MKKMQSENEKNYLNAIDDMKNELTDLWSDSIKDKMLDERRKWIMEFIDKNNFSSVPNSAKEFYER